MSCVRTVVELPSVRRVLQPFKLLFRRIRACYWNARDCYFLFFPFERKLQRLEEILNLKEMGIYESGVVDEQAIHIWFSLHRQDVSIWPQSERETLFQLIKLHYPDKVLHLDQEVKKILRHEFSYYGMTFSRDKAINWLVDPISGKSWPKQYFAVPYDIRGFGDPLYTRRLNMLFHLVPLAQMYGLQKEQAILVEIQEQLADWVGSHPFKMTVSWTSALEVAIRTITLLWVVQFVGIYALGPKTFGSLLRLLFWHGKFLEENLSVDMESPNNHLIGEAGALMVLGLAFPDFREARGWVERGWTVLEKQCHHQFYPLGAHREQAIGYHYFVVEICTLVYLYSRNRRDLGPEFTSRLHSMFQYIFDSSQGSLPPPDWGDTSDLYFLPALAKNELEHVRLLSLGSVIFQSEEFKSCVAQFSFSAVWILGVTGYHRFQQLAARPPTDTSKGYTDSGVYIMRDGWNPEDRFMAIDCGALGLGYSGHGHADALSIEVSALGQKFIVDSGTYSYHASRQWRDFFRGTSAHNTVVIDEQDQAEPRGVGPFGWIPFKKPEIHQWWMHPRFDYFDGTICRDSVDSTTLSHRRRVVFVKGEYWLISDSIDGDGRHTCQSLFHFRPGNVFLDREAQYVETQYQESHLLLAYFGDNIHAQILEGSENPIQGWLSSGYGQKTPSPVLQLVQKQVLPTYIDVVLYPFSEALSPKIKVQDLLVRNENGDGYSSSQCRGLTVRFSDHEDFFVFCDRTESGKLKIAEDLAFDGHTVYLRVRQGRVLQGFMLGGAHCTVFGRDVPASFVFVPHDQMCRV